MKETTENRQVEGPAVVFSEKGWAMFLSFLERQGQGVVERVMRIEPNDDEVDAFLNNWREHKGIVSKDQADVERVEQKRTRRTGPRKPEAVYVKQYETLKGIMGVGNNIRLKDIYNGMQGAGQWRDVEPKQAASKMVNLMRRFPNIEPLGGGLYRLNGEEGTAE